MYSDNSIGRECGKSLLVKWTYVDISQLGTQESQGLLINYEATDITFIKQYLSLVIAQITTIHNQVCITLKTITNKND